MILLVYIGLTPHSFGNYNNYIHIVSMHNGFGKCRVGAVMKKVLIADDSLFMRSLLNNKISGHGFIIIAEAQDGEEAIMKYRETFPDIVLLDITMPNTNGLVALEGIMQIDPNAKVVMCSAIGQQAVIIEAIQKGAKDFIVKPFFDNLVSILNNL